MNGDKEAQRDIEAKEKRHDIMRGKVRCPLQGEVDVELCFYCPFTEAVDMDSPIKSITCIPNMSMSQEDKIAYQRLGVLRLAQTIGNVSRVCRERGISRTQFYKYRDRYLAYGIEGLRDATTIRHKAGYGLSQEALARIIEINLAHPSIGCVRIAEMLQSAGFEVTPVVVQSVLAKEGLGTKQKRIYHLETMYHQQQCCLSPEQIAEVERHNPCFRERHEESRYPGEILAQDTLYVGQIRGIGKIYMQAVVDTYGSYAFAFLHAGKLPKYAVTLLQNDVLRFYKHRRIAIRKIVTDHGREYCGNRTHPFEYYLSLNDIEHATTEVGSHLIHGFVEAFQRDVTDEFFKPTWKDKLYDSIADLQKDLDHWLVFYNEKRPHPGYRNMGLTPNDTIIHYLATLKVPTY